MLLRARLAVVTYPKGGFTSVFDTDVAPAAVQRVVWSHWGACGIHLLPVRRRKAGELPPALRKSVNIRFCYCLDNDPPSSMRLLLTTPSALSLEYCFATVGGLWVPWYQGEFVEKV